MLKIGTITPYKSGVDLVVEWKINDFFNFPDWDGANYISPTFLFGGVEWYLGIYPNAWSPYGEDRLPHVDVQLCKRCSYRSIKQSFSLSLKTVRGEKYNEQHVTKDFKNGWGYHSFNRFIDRSELSSKRSELVPEGHLTIICMMKSSTSSGTVSNTASTSDKCCHCKGAFDAESLSTHQRKCMHRPIKCPDCLEIVVLQQWLDEHECQKERSQGKSLGENSKNNCVEACTETENENGYNCREKLLMVLCIASILIAIVTGSALAYPKTQLSSTHPCGESVNKTLVAEMNKTDQSEIAGSDIPEASAANEADTGEPIQSEFLPQPILMVTEVGSTYLEVVWVLPEVSKLNAAHIQYIVHFRKYGAEWQEVSFPEASRTSYSLTNLDPGMFYQIYVMAIDSSGFSRCSKNTTVRTNSFVHHNSPEGHGKQFVLYAAAIVILVIIIACVYDYSKTSLSATHPYGVTFNNVLEDCGFVTDINHLLKENRGVDVTFELDTPSGETKLFAHQLILAVMSSYFADEFYDKGRNKGHQVIPLKGINLKAFEQMIRYCYGENPIFETAEEVCALFKVAFEFKVISLQNLCRTFFRHTKIEPGNVFSILKISVEMEDKRLQDMCYHILQEKTREVVAAYELHHITPAMVYTLLKLPKLSLNSEYELIKWIFDWAKVKSGDARDYLERLLKDMNFLALRFEEFAILCKDYQGFFNSDEIVSIYQNIAHPGTREMPEWFNKDLKCRVYTGSNE